jgi:hypothetical protein
MYKVVFEFETTSFVLYLYVHSDVHTVDIAYTG